MTRYTEVRTAQDVTEEILSAAEGIDDGWFADEKIDWEDFVDRLDGISLDDGTRLDMGDSMVSPAIAAIKKHIRERRKL